MEVRALIEGYKRFYKNYFTSGDKTYSELADGQSPKTLILTCSDSRVDPSILTDCGPGDIFVIRNVANIVPPYEQSEGLHGVSAALEFGITVLGVKHVVVMGHSRCAGVDALVKGNVSETTDFIGDWVECARPARTKALELYKGDDHKELRRCCAQENVLLSVERLATFPWIKSRIEEGKLKLHGWYFSVNTGRLAEYSKDENKFVNVPV